MDSVLAASDVMRALHKPSVEAYRRILGSHFDALIRVDGHIEAWEEVGVSTNEQIGRTLRQRHGIELAELGIDELCQMVPAMTPTVKRAHFVRNGAHTAKPLNLAATLAEIFVTDGGRMLREEAMRILPLDGGYRIVTNVGDYQVGKGGDRGRRLDGPAAGAAGRETAARSVAGLSRHGAGRGRRPPRPHPEPQPRICRRADGWRHTLRRHGRDRRPRGEPQRAP